MFSFFFSTLAIAITSILSLSLSCPNLMEETKECAATEITQHCLTRAAKSRLEWPCGGGKHFFSVLLLLGSNASQREQSCPTKNLHISVLSCCFSFRWFFSFLLFASYPRHRSLSFKSQSTVCFDVSRTTYMYAFGLGWIFILCPV